MRSELAHSRARSEFFKQRSQLLSSQLLESKNSLMRVRRDIVQDVASGGSGSIRGDFGNGSTASSSRVPVVSRDEKSSTTMMPPEATQDPEGTILDPKAIKRKAIAALRELIKQVGLKESEYEYHFEVLPDYD